MLSSYFSTVQLRFKLKEPNRNPLTLVITWLMGIVLIVPSHVAYSQKSLPVANAEFQVTHQTISVEDGLASRDVRASVMDRQGFMWFATSMGLDRYDGKNFLHFTMENQGLFSNSVSYLSLDVDGNLIIGLVQMIDQTERGDRVGVVFQVMDIASFKLKSLNEAWPNAPFDLSNVFNVRNYDDGGLLVLKADPYEAWSMSGNRQWQRIAELSAWNDVDRMSRSSELSVFAHSSFQNEVLATPSPGQGLPGYFISKERSFAFEAPLVSSVMCLSKNNEACFYSDFSHSGYAPKNRKNGFYKVLPNGSSVVANEFASLPLISDEYWSICSSNIAGEFMCFNPDFGLYLFTEGKYLKIFDKVELLDRTDLFIFSMYADRFGNRWLSTTTGIIQITIKNRVFENYFSKKDRSSVRNNQVRGIFTEPSPTNRFEEIIYANVWDSVLTAPDLRLTMNRSPKPLCPISEHAGALFTGLYFKLNKKEGLLEGLDCGISNIDVWSQMSLNDSLLLIGTHLGEGIYIYNSTLRILRSVRCAHADIPTPFLVYRFIRSKNKGLIALGENGIYRLDDQYNIVEYWGPTAPLDHKIEIRGFYDLFEDSEGICWIATANQGLFRWDWNSSLSQQQPQLRQFGLAEGLPSLRLYRIEEDDDANLWISGYNGLTRLEKKTYSVINFSTRDGLTHNEFNRISSFKSTSGKLYFGGVNGLNAFYPAAVDSAYLNAIFPLRVIHLNKYSSEEDELVSCMEEWNSKSKLIISHADRFLTVEFALLDFMKRAHIYAYRIDGIDADWNYITDGSLRISQLAYGNYTLHVKAQLNNGQWNPEELVIPIQVLEPFYLRPSYWILFLIGLLLLVLLINFIRRRKLERDNKKMEALVLNRTVNLKKALDEKEVLLKEVHHRVKNNLQIVSGLLQMQKEELSNMADGNNNHFMNDGQSRIISMALIHQNLYQQSDISSVRFDIFLKSLVVHVADLFAIKGRKLICDVQIGEVYIDIDTAVPLGLITNELVTNSYKYGFLEKQDVHVQFHLEVLSKGIYKLTYRDSGPGFPPNIDSAKANTLGLNLIRGLTRQLSGECVQYNDSGAVFVITFKDSELRGLE